MPTRIVRNVCLPMLATAMVLLAPLMATADDWKDESGKRNRGDWGRYDGQWDRRGGDRDWDRRGDGHDRDQVQIPSGHLPPPGECRDWYLNRPAGHQPPPYRC